MSATETAFYVLGTGRVGTTLATALQQRNLLAGCWTRSESTAARLSRVLSVDVAFGVPPSIEAENVVVVVAVPDRAVSRVLGAHPDRTNVTSSWLHVSGSLGQTVFADAGVAGTTGVAHPLHSFSAAGTQADELAGAVMAVSGDVGARNAGVALAEALRCVPVEIPDEQSVAYHLAATLASNGVYALLHGVRSVLSDAGMEDERLITGMARLAAQSAESARSNGVCEAATGPVIRGDANTVQSHRRWLSDQRSEVSELYDELSRILLAIADERGLSPRLVAALSAVMVEQGR